VPRTHSFASIAGRNYEKSLAKVSKLRSGIAFARLTVRIMICSAQEFSQLCASLEPEHQHRATTDTAPEEVWVEVLNTYPENTI
jgi:hypothetical protein